MLYGSFDPLGRVTSSTQTTAGKSYPFSNYSYDLSGHLNAETYPSGRVVGYEYDLAGRVNQVSGWTSSFGTKDYATGILYAPQGAPKSIPLHNGLTATSQFNNRLQATQVALGTAGLPSSVWGVANCYARTDNAGCVTAAANNGNLQQQMLTTIGATQTFAYDPLATRQGRSAGEVEASNAGEQLAKE